MSAATEALARILNDAQAGAIRPATECIADLNLVRKALEEGERYREAHEPEVPDPGPRGDVGPRGQAGLKGPSGIKIEMTPEGAAKMNEALAKFVTRPRWWQR